MRVSNSIFPVKKVYFVKEEVGKYGRSECYETREKTRKEIRVLDEKGGGSKQIRKIFRWVRKRSTDKRSSRLLNIKFVMHVS